MRRLRTATCLFFVVGVWGAIPDSVRADDGCIIVIGGGGETQDFRRLGMRPGDTKEWRSVRAADFIRSTEGPCFFTVFSGEAFSGRSVVVGTNLSGQIRAGLDGVRNAADGGGETWRIRSVRMTRYASNACRLRIGTSGIRMDYNEGRFATVPIMDRISFFGGGDCRAKVWLGGSFGRDDSDNRFKALHPRGGDSTYDPGFRIRSFVVENDGNTCSATTKDAGRCLPQIELPRSLYFGARNDPGADADRDGLDDASENSLAQAMRPIYVNHSTEDATRVDVYHTAATGEAVMEPVTLFQVAREGENEIVVRFMKLWLWDKYEAPGACGGHKGDSQRHRIYLRTTPVGDPKRGRFWWVYRTWGGVEGELGWEQDDGSIRGVHFERIDGERGIANHLVIYLSRGKHHEYADGGWSGQDDKNSGCTAFITARVNGRGERHDPPLPRRAAILQAPPNLVPRGSPEPHLGFNNVGSARVPFINDLTPFGFPGECVWTCGNFFDASPASQGFD